MSLVRNKCRLSLVAGFALALAAGLHGQTGVRAHPRWDCKRHRAELIDHAKKYLVSGIEPGLPRRSFSKWFRRLVGREAKLTWKIADCGYEAGDGGARDHTMCVVANATLGSDLGVTVYIQFGTFQGGITPGKPLIRYARVSREDEPSQATKSLAELPRTVRLIMSK